MKLFKKIKRPIVLTSLLLVVGILASLLSASNASFVLAQNKPLPPLQKETVRFDNQAPQSSDAANEDLEKDASTDINVKNADIAAIVKVFSKKTKRNYILDENVRGKVSIYLPGKVTQEEALQILESVLALKGFTSVPVSKNLWKIIPAREAKGATIPTRIGVSGDDITAAIVTRLVNLKYVSAEDMQQIVSQMISPNGVVNAYTGTNALIIIDSEDNVERLVNIINSLDVPYTNQEMTIVPVKYAEATDIAEKLKEILTDEKSNSTNTNNIANPNGQPRFFNNQAALMPPRMNNLGGAQAGASNGQTINSRAKEPKIIADERTNSIILLADDETTAKIKALIDQLDSQVDLSGNRFYVYRCQHANAEDLAEVLSGLGTDSNGDSKRGNPGLVNTGNQNKTQQRLKSQSRVLGTSRLDSKKEEAGASATFGEDFSITADASTNSLVIKASKADYRKVLELLSELDVKRRQVLVEAMLLEVGLSNQDSIGMEWMTSGGGKDGGIFATNTQGSLNQLFSNPSQLNGFTVAAASSGSLTLGNITVPTHSVLMEAVSNSSNVNILSAPNLMTADNEEAEIVVGQNVPFLASTSSSSDNLSNTFNQVDRQDVGITLRLTPRISEGDFVTLKVFTEVSSVVAATANSSLGPTTTVRTSETTVIAKDNQMIVIGGLISDNTSEADDGVPFLKDIPLLGYAFKKHNTAFDKTNLLIFITPRVVRDQFDARDSTYEEKQKMEDVIAFGDVVPDRNDILKNEKIDRVATSEEYEGAVPSTIRATGNNSNAIPQSTGDVLKLKAAPRIKNKKWQRVVDNSTNTPQENMKASIDVNKISNTQTQNKEGKFIVMRLLSKDNQSQFKASNRLFGVSMPTDVNAYAKGFFEPGAYYVYNNNGQKLQMYIEGVFKTQDDAEYVYSDLKNASWHNLSSFEIFNLGKNPWLKASSK